MSTSKKKYRQLSDLIGLGVREIARRTGFSPTTVGSVLDEKKDPISYSKATEVRIQKTIEQEAEKVYFGIERLSGGAFLRP